MKKLLTNLLVFSLAGIIPLFILTCGYIYYDPFKVLYHYNDYSNSYVELNRDIVSTRMFEMNAPKHDYNSYIFGSSRTYAFRPLEWQKHLSPGARPFSFDASSENIYGIYSKVKYLDDNNYKIDNALIVLCRDQSFDSFTNMDGALFIKDPETSHENKLKFQLVFFKAYLNPHFLISFYYYTYTHHYKAFMKDYINDKRNFYDAETNALMKKDRDQEITNNPARYYEENKDRFYPRPAKERTDSVQRINADGKYMLKEIALIFEKHHTAYKVVLSPLYEQIKFSKNDLDILKGIFGGNVYDFSGKNSFTDNKFNYYENSHYRLNVGDSIMNYIYKK